MENYNKEIYISNIIKDEEIANIRAGEFNILKAPRGTGKTAFCFNEKILNFARAKKHVLYLVQNKLTRDYIADRHDDKACVFMDCNCNGWFFHRKKGLWTTDADEDRVHVMCYQTFAALLRNEGVDWLEDIDLIVWDEFDDVKSYYEKEVKDLKKILPDFSREELINILQRGKSRSVVNFVYQIKTFVLEPARIKLLAISASPENAALYFRDYINYILYGQIEEKYYAKETIYISSVINAIKDETIKVGRKYWCLTRFIHDGFRIAAIGASKGFNPIVLWSETNKDWSAQMTQERKEALRMLRDEHMAPPQYDLIIITSVGGRAFDIYDTTIQDWICDSTEYEDIVQYIRARFCPAREYLLEKARGIIDFTQNGFSIDYYQWHSLKELQQLLEEKPIYTSGPEKIKKLTTFNSVKKAYPDLFEKRIYGKNHLVQYRIKPAE